MYQIWAVLVSTILKTSCYNCNRLKRITIISQISELPVIKTNSELAYRKSLWDILCWEAAQCLQLLRFCKYFFIIPLLPSKWRLQLYSAAGRQLKVNKGPAMLAITLHKYGNVPHSSTGGKTSFYTSPPTPVLNRFTLFTCNYNPVYLTRADNYGDLYPAVFDLSVHWPTLRAFTQVFKHPLQ